jgi:hypothetical protein
MFLENMLVPYTDVTLYPPFDISTGPVKNYYLGFIVADGDNDPSWGGYHKTTSNYYTDQIVKLRKKGGDVIASFGGAAGTELATSTVSVVDLYEKYKSVIERYNLKQIDFDIEGTTIHNQEANKRRGEAIATLLKVFPKLKVVLTVPVMPFGLDQDALACMNTTPHHLLNIMAMDFGREENMGKAVISALLETRKQTQKDIAVTVMIGKNDTTEVFTTFDAVLLREFVNQNGWVKRISFWSIERDQGLSGPLATSSNVQQSKWQFSNLLK